MLKDSRRDPRREDTQEPKQILSHSKSIRERFPASQALLAMILTILLLLALIDAVVETFLSASPLRWIVFGLVGAYAAGMLLFWNRLTWTGKATSAFFAILSLLAVTAWLPAGLTHGVSLVRQQTSTVLALTTALAVAVSAGVLIRSGFLPPSGRWAVGIIALYAVWALTQAAIIGTPFADLFRGKSFWTQFPRWFQGAVVGSLILMPAGISLQILSWFTRYKGKIRRGTLLQALGLGMVLVIAIAGLRVPSSHYATPFSSVASAETKRLEESIERFTVGITGAGGRQQRSDQITERLANSLEIAEAVVQDLAAETIDIQSFARKLGHDPAAIFKWVRDQTSLVPYRGVLRGAQGVLMDRSGNSLDRSLLLIGLLEAGGLEARLARSMLSQNQVDDLLRTIQTINRGPMIANSRNSSQSRASLMREIGRRTQLDPKRILELLNGVEQEGGELIQAARARAASQTGSIASLIGGPSGDVSAEAEIAARSALRDHWWVQVRQDGGWVDLDPTLPTAEPGLALTSSLEVTEPAKLSGDLFHEIHLQVVIEQWIQGQVREKSVLRQVLRPLELYGKRVAIAHYPVKWPDESIPSSMEDPFQRLKAAVLAQTEWVPTLELDSDPVVQWSFTDAGEVNQRPIDALLGSGGQTVGRRVENILRSGGGRHPDRETAQKAHLTAEWIEYEIRSPGQSTRTVRREIFDLLGPAARSGTAAPKFEMSDTSKLKRGLALMGETEILPLAGQLSPALVELSFLRSLLENREVLHRMVPDGNIGDMSKLIEQSSRIAAASPILSSLAIARGEWSPHRDILYLDKPNIFAFHRKLILNNPVEIGLQVGFDIVVNDVAVLPVPGVNPFQVRLAQGVLETNAEALFVALACRASKPLNCAGPIGNAAEIFATSSGHGIEWVRISNTQDRSWKTLDLPADVRARLELDLQGGYVVLVPRRPVSIMGSQQVAWWRVDPRTGQTLGIGESGAGQAAENMLARRLTTGQKHVIAIALLNGYFAGLYLQDCHQSGGGTGYCFAKFLCLSIGFGFAFAAGMTGFLPVAAYMAAATNGACRLW